MASLITKGTTPLDKSNTGVVNFVKIESIDESSGNITITQKISLDEHNGYLHRSQLKENDILFSIAGTLGRVTSVKSSILPANTNQALAIIRLKDGCLDYVKTYLKGKAVADFIKKNPTIGAQPNLSLEQVANLEIIIPSEDEQKIIGAFFQQLDNLITLHQCKCQIDGCRFQSPLAITWEQRKLGEIGSVSMCRRIFKEQTSENGEIPFYKIGTFGGEADAFISRELFEEYKAKYQYPKKGDILISASGSIGRTVVFTGKNEYFQDSNIVWLNHDKHLDNSFLKCFYSIVKWAGIEGSTIKRLYNDNILNTAITLPSVEEQQKIGAYFENLDNLITLHQCE